MESLNQDIFRLLFSLAHQNIFLDLVIVFCAKYLAYLLVIGFFVFILLRKDNRVRLFIFIEGALAVIISRSIITETIRFFYHHPRPFEALSLSPLVQASGDSFPSGHAVTFFALATILYYFDKRLGGWFFLFAFMNGVSRIVAGVHWPLDILGGIVIGILSGVIVHALSKNNWEKMAGPVSNPEQKDMAK